MKDNLFKEIMYNEYNAIFQMTGELIAKCPDNLWDKETNEPPFWQQIYHTIFYLDFYLSDSPKKHIHRFSIKEDLKEKQTQTLSKKDLQSYLIDLTKKTNQLLNELSSKDFESKNSFYWTGPTMSHRLVYNIRHAQHHIGKLNSMLRRHENIAVSWIIDSRKENSK
jgi:uncharacterized damage-inducible protein DinB